MTGLILIIIIAIWVLMYRPSIDGTRDLPVKISEKLDQLWGIAQESIRDNRYLRAEKALLEIAQSLEPSASSLHNVGLMYYETGNYPKAALAFEQAIEIEDDLAARYIAYAKTQEKLGSDRKMIDALEKAVELEPIPQTLTVLAEAYERVGQHALAMPLREKVSKLLNPTPEQPRQQRQPRQPRKVIM